MVIMGKLSVATIGVVGAVALAWLPLAAQAPAKPGLPTVVEGLTVDVQSGLPFPNIQLRFDTGERVTSDDAGRYSIDGIAPGHHRVALVTARCNVTFAEVDVAPGEIKRIAFQVPSEMVGVTPAPEEMKSRSEGLLYTGQELRDMRAQNTLDALRRIAPEMVGSVGGQPGMVPSLMGRTRTAAGISKPLVVVDGIVVNDGARALEELLPDQVASLEILKGASRGWAYGTGAAGGVIKVVTRHGELGHAVQPPDRCDIGDWVHRSGGGA
jgi:hypothetical protein